MSYFEFPHTRNYDGDLGYIIKKLDELTKRYNNFFDYNSIKFHDPIIWSIETVYTAFEIVYDETSEAFYISKTAVPSGIDITNEDFWLLVTPFKTDNEFNANSLNPISNKAVTKALNIMETDITALNSRLTEEISSRIAGDNTLSGRITENSENIDKESAARTNDISLVNARIDDIIALEPGSTTGDAELQDIRLSASGYTYTTAGDAVRGQIETVTDKINIISSNTGNLFNKYNILIGKKADGTAGFPKRAISAIVKNSEDGLFVKKYAGSAFKFLVAYYSSNSYADYITGSPYITDDTTFHIPSTYPYIALLFSKNDDTNITPSDFDDVKIMLNDSNGIRSFEEPITANDNYARQHINGLYSNNPFGLLPVDSEWRKSSISEGSEVYNGYRLLSDFVEVPEYSLLNVKFSYSGYSIALVRYDKNKNYISMTSYINSSSDTHTFKNVGNKYVRFLVKFTDDSFINPSDIFNSGISVTINENTYNKNEFSVLTYNVGHWNYGSSTMGIPEETFDEKILNLRRFFGEVDCDLVGIQEFTRLIDQAGTTQSNDEIFDHFYKYSRDTGTWEALKSKYEFTANGQGTFTIAPDRYYVYANAQIGDKEVYLLNVHLTPGHGAAYATLRAAEADEIITMLSDKEHFILFGDFNPDPGEEVTLFKKFTDAGFNIANNGFFGKYWTVSSNRDDFNHYDTPTGTVYYVDNVITSSNIGIMNCKPLNVYNELVSDHIPLLVKLAIN